MKRGNKRIIAVLTLMFVVLIGTTVFGADEEAKYVPQLFGTFWAFVQPATTILIYACVFQYGLKSTSPVITKVGVTFSYSHFLILLI